MQDVLNSIITSNGSPPVTHQTSESLIIYLNEQYSLRLDFDLLCISIIFTKNGVNDLTVQHFSTQQEWLQTVESFLKFFDFTIKMPYRSLDR